MGSCWLLAVLPPSSSLDPLLLFAVRSRQEDLWSWRDGLGSARRSTCRLVRIFLGRCGGQSSCGWSVLRRTGREILWWMESLGLLSPVTSATR